MRSYWPLMLLAGVLALGGVTAAVLVGCGSESNSNATEDDDPAAPDTTPDELFAGWPEPAVAILLSGEQHGYLEPCGCTELQTGGMARRADLVRRMEDRDWPVVGIDLGDTVKRNRRQSELKFETIKAALADLHYVALGLGEKELEFDPGFLISQHVTDPQNPTESLAFLGANVQFYGVPDLDGGPKRWKVVTVGGVKIGMTSVLGEELRKKFPAGGTSGVTITDPTEALSAVLAEMEAEKPDLLVLLSHAALDESRQWAKDYPQFDVILSAGGYEDPDKQPETIGETLLITVGQKGKYVGVLGVYPKDKKQPLRYELVSLDRDRFDESPLMREHMRIYQDNLRDYSEEVFASMPKATHPDGSFVGAKKCGECHTKAHDDKWIHTKHAHAYESLSRGRKGQEENWISRVHDAECLACHVTGWDPQQVVRYETGFLPKDLTTEDPSRYELLRGQQCENCHGPGAEHVALEESFKRDAAGVKEADLKSARLQVKLSLEVAEKTVCVKCHDADNSPNFDFAKYWEEVKHPWRD